MINRRTFAALLAGTVAAPKRAWSEPVTAKTVFYTSVGPDMTLFDIDIADATLQKRGAVTLPANIQYAWPHPSKRFLYIVSSNGGPGVAGDKHLASAFRVDPASGALDPARGAAGAAVAPDPYQCRQIRRVSAHRLQ